MTWQSGPSITPSTSAEPVRYFTEPQPSPHFRPGAPSMHDIAARLHLLRRDHGAQKYDSLLQCGNGRDASIDQLQESLDRIVYEIQLSLERRAMVEALEQYRVDLDEMVKWGGGAEMARARFDELLTTRALALRADELATAMLGETP